MNKNRKIILLWISILILISISFFILANEFSKINEKKDLIWVSKTPHQCWDYTVPNKIYFDRPDIALFYGTNKTIDFPLEFNQTANFMEYINEEVRIVQEAMKRNNASEEQINNLSNQIVSEYSYVFYQGNLSTKVVYIYDSKKFYAEEGFGTCASCSCPEGYSVNLLIDSKDLNLFLEMGYEKGK